MKCKCWRAGVDPVIQLKNAASVVLASFLIHPLPSFQVINKQVHVAMNTAVLNGIT